jgi:branched-chain amino acid transport system permease protein
VAAVPGFLDQHLIDILNGLAIGMLLFTLAIGLSLIFGLADVLNLAHGGIYLLGGYVAFEVIVERGQSFWLALPVAAAFGLAFGALLTGLLRPIRNRGHLDQALLTLGLTFVIADVATIFWGNDYQSIPTPPELFRSEIIFDQFYPRYRLVVMGIGLVLAVLVYLLFERTQLGAVLRAAVEDSGMVAGLGVNVGLIMLAVLALGSALAAFGGVVGAPILGLGPGIDIEILILALIVVVIGGLGSIPGAFVGAILIGEAQSLGVALFPEFAAFTLFGVMAVVLAIRPEGLFGSAR